MKPIKLKQDMEKYEKPTAQYPTYEEVYGNKGTTAKLCTCKIDKESNLTIDKACYWHGK